MRKLDALSYRTMPWKNGGGTTTEIARASASPDSLDDLDWRVSMARVEGAGPFSRFDGVDRTIAILDGDGLTLALGERGARGSVTLERESPPFAFPADLEVMATLVGGPIEDFNVMTRRGRYRHLLSRTRLASPLALPSLGDLTLVVVACGHVEATEHATHERLGRRDALVVQRGKPVTLTAATGGAELLLVDLWRTG